MRWPIVLLAACAARYEPGSFPVEAHPIGSCLDVGVQAGQRSEAKGPVVVLRLGNRCDHNALVDLASARVVGGSDRGVHAELHAFDPDHEIGPRRIVAYGSGEEWIEYEPAGAYDWLDVDIGRIAGDVATTWVRISVPR